MRPASTVSEEKAAEPTGDRAALAGERRVCRRPATRAVRGQPARGAVRGPRPRRPGRAAGRAGDSGRGARGAARDQGRRAVPVRAHGRRRRRGDRCPARASTPTTRATSRRSASRSATLPRSRSPTRRSTIARSSTRPTPACDARGLAPVPQQSLSISRELMIACGPPVLPGARAQLPARVGDARASRCRWLADFADIFEVRGGPRREARGHALAPKQIERGLVLAYVGEDEVFREAVIELDPPPARVELGAVACRRTGR